MAGIEADPIRQAESEAHYNRIQYELKTRVHDIPSFAHQFGMILCDDYSHLKPMIRELMLPKTGENGLEEGYRMVGGEKCFFDINTELVIAERGRFPLRRSAQKNDYFGAITNIERPAELVKELFPNPQFYDEGLEAYIMDMIVPQINIRSDGVLEEFNPTFGLYDGSTKERKILYPHVATTKRNHNNKLFFVARDGKIQIF